jgi:hypothetical protein
MKLNGRTVIDAEVEGADPSDYPDFCDAYFSAAYYADTLQPLTDAELEQLGEAYCDVLNEMAFDSFL